MTDEPPQPGFVEVLDFYSSASPARVEALVESDRRMVLTTQNVRRIRIDRAAAGLSHERSVALILDGQGIEWTARSLVREFERSDSGGWRPIEAARP